jgi:hypothetical protein
MKKVSLYIGIFIVFFLAVGVYMAQAVVADGLNGTWLKLTGSIKGLEFAGGPGSEEVGKNDNDSLKLYGCILDGPFYDNQFFVQLYEKASDAIPAGVGVFEKKAGTADKFAGWFTMNLMVGYVPANPYEYTTSLSVPGEMTIKRNNLGNIDKVKFKGFYGQAEKKPEKEVNPTIYTGYALYGVKKINAESATKKSLPFDENTACPAGHIINVKKIDDGVHTGSIEPAGPWVPVSTGADQAFTITTTSDNTAVYVYVDNIEAPVYENTSTGDAGFTYTYTFSAVNANRSIWVRFD